jgi:hypothetical protein
MRTNKRTIRAAKTDDRKIIAMTAPVSVIKAADGADASAPRKFEVKAYSGGALTLFGWDKPVIIDLAGMGYARSIVANLDHNGRQRVGHVTDKNKTEAELQLGGVFSAATAFRDEVVASADGGFGWEASIEATPNKVVDLESGKTAKVNGQDFTGPAYIVRKSTLSGFAFVSHGADPATDVKIAAGAASNLEHDMTKELQAWIEEMGLVVADLTAEQIAGLERQHNGIITGTVKKPARKLDEQLDEKQAEVERVDAITAMAVAACDKRPYDIEAIKKIADTAITTKMSLKDFRIELLEAATPPGHTMFAPRNRDNRLSDRVLEAAVCMAGRLKDHEEMFDDQTLQAAHDRFKSGIGLRQLFVIAAQSNGFNPTGYEVNLDVQRAAFNMTGPGQIRATSFSTINLPNVFSNVANKFMRQGWMAVDQTLLRICAVRNVSDFKEIKTVSLTGGLMFQDVGADGELKHGQLGEVAYGNKADTRGIIFAITRTDMINDDLGALTAVPKRIGRGGMLKLNDIGWREFLDNASFFSAGNGNTSTVEGRLNSTGLSEAETKFLSQTDPDGNILGSQPAILLTPTALKSAGSSLMTSEKIVTGESSTQPDNNIWKGRFRLESTPYLHNASYTGNSSSAWYLLADPEDLPVLEIAALNGRVEPVVETAAAEFNVLGVEMRGYNDVGVRKQEHRGGVRADGSSP